ncbi:hypothetical protein V6N13_134074 [Hibiscus sabdariffa]
MCESKVRYWVRRTGEGSKGNGAFKSQPNSSAFTCESRTLSPGEKCGSVHTAHYAYYATRHFVFYYLVLFLIVKLESDSFLIGCSKVVQ